MFHKRVYGRASFIRRLNILRHDPFAHSWTICIADISQFSWWTANFGYDHSQTILRNFVERCRSVTNCCIFGRIEPDKICMAFRNTILDDVLLYAQAICEVMRSPIAINGHRVIVAMNIGIAHATHGTCDMEILLQHALIALLEAKNNHDCVRIFTSDMARVQQEQFEFEHALRQAVQWHQDQFSLAYQPIVNMSDKTLVGFEALLRWQHPTQGSISAAKFIPIAIRTGLIHELGLWVFAAGCRQASAWMTLFPDHAPIIAINISPIQLHQSGIVQAFEKIIIDVGIDPKMLKIEVTEEQFDVCAEVVQEIAALGCAIAIDDFGQGHSSLARLRDMPVHTLKLDRLFIEHVDIKGRAAEIIRSTLSLGKALNMEVIVEGVEEEEEADVLRAIGCSLAQGYLFGRPLSVVDAQARIVLQVEAS